MKISISKSLTYLALFCSIFYLQGCGDSNVEAVKGGVLFHYQDAKIGPVFEANFTNIRWSSSNKNGRNCVTFTGKISKATHEKMAKLINPKDRNLDIILTQVAPDLYKNREEEVSKKIQSDIDSLSKQHTELESLLEETVSQEGSLNSEKSDFERKLSEREDTTQYRESEIKRTKEKFEKRKIDFQRYKNTNDEAYMKEYLDNAEAEYKNELARMEITKGKNAQFQKEYEKWKSQDNESKIEGLRKKIEELRGKKLAIFEKILKLNSDKTDEIEKMKESLRGEIIGKYFWTEGDPVEIEFVVHPEANIEIKEMKGNSWNKFRLSMSDILDGIYK